MNPEHVFEQAETLDNAENYAINVIHAELVKIKNDSLPSRIRRMKVIRNNLNFIESKFNYCTILDYCKAEDIRLPLCILGELDKKACLLSHQYNIPIGRVPHKVFGILNLYRDDLLDAVMQEED